VLLGGSLAPFGDGVDVKFINRLGQIAAAAAYVVMACKLPEFRLAQARESEPVEP
jgi:hypothetical protein